MENNLTELANSLSEERIIELMSELGADEHQRTNNAIIFRTICHNADPSDASMKLYYYPNTHTFHCYTDCGCTFNIYEMFKKRYEILGKDYSFYKDIVLRLGGGQHKKETSFNYRYESLFKKENHTPQVDIKPINKGLLNCFTFYPTPEWLEDGISEAAMKRFNILFSIEENKIIIPHYDIDSNLIGIRCRPLNDEDLLVGKYMPIKIEGTIYSHPLGFNLYGLNVVKDNIKKFKTAIVTEGEKGVLQYETMFGSDNNIAVAACGSNFQKYQLDLLLKCGAERVLIAFDKEGETWKEQTRYFNKLKGLCERYKNYCKMGFIYDSGGLLKLKQSPFDCGAEVAAKLIRKGVWI